MKPTSNSVVRLTDGNTALVLHVPAQRLVLKVRVGDHARTAALREVELARAIARWTVFVQPAQGDHAVVELAGGAVATVWPYLSSGCQDLVLLGQRVRALHRNSQDASSARNKLSLRRLDDLTDVGVEIDALRTDRRISERGYDVLARTCEQLQTELIRLRSSPVVVHGDLHLRNVIWSLTGPVLCDADEIGMADPRWDIAFLLDPGRPRSLRGTVERDFVDGYGGAPTSVDEIRVFARSAHLRRTVRHLRAPRVRDRQWWNHVWIGSWSRMIDNQELDLVPPVALSRFQQLTSARTSWRLC